MTWRPDSNGWRRYRGSGVRGRPTTLRVAAVDLQHAVDALVQAKVGLELAMAAESPRQRQQALSEARASADLAQRFTRGVLRGALSAERAKAPRQAVSQLKFPFKTKKGTSR